MSSEDSTQPRSGRQPPEAGMKQTPVRLLAMLAVAVFAIEMAIMVALSWPPSLPAWIQGLLDATILTVLLFPVIYFLMLRPLQTAYTHKILVQHRLEKQLDELQRLHNATLGRELRMKELYEENQALKARLGEQEK